MRKVFNRIFQAVCLLAVFAAPVSVHAHPGHGQTDPESVPHYVLEPIHMLATVAIVGALIAIVFVLTRHLSTRRRIPTS